MVLVVMVRTVQRIRFANEIGNLSQRLWAKIGVLGSVGHHVDVMLGRYFRSQSKLAEVLPGEDPGIFKLLHVGDREVCRAARSRNRMRAAADWSERGADAPACRNNHRRLYGNIAHRR